MGHKAVESTADIGILTFEEALENTGLEDYDRDGWIYIPDHYSEYRYVLGTRGTNPLIAIGINPSTARPGALDNTLKRVETRAMANGFDSFIMFNVYAQRATDPNGMEREFNPRLHEENMKAFRYILSKCGRPSVWAAWGTNIMKRPYLLKCVSDMVEAGRSAGAVWYTCGERSAVGGHPHHPLYVPSSAPLEPFDVATYLEDLRGDPGEK